MALSWICFSSPSNQSRLMQTHQAIQLSKTRLISSSMPIPNNAELFLSSSISKRTLSLSIVAFILSVAPPMAKGEGEQTVQFQRYTDYIEGFTLLRPSSYMKVDKAGATVLFEEMNKGANNIGIVVTPVRLTSLRDFGSPEFVADKLVQAEKRKESTKEVELIAAVERPGQGNFPVYEFEYKVDSTRGGMKRIFSAAFVSQKKLYLLNIAHADKPESPLESNSRLVLEQVLHSFDIMPLT